jgi:hypothetical protein
MIERSASAKYAISVFHENFNDFDVYVEDTAIGYSKIFATLLSKALLGTFTLDRVYPLGGRRAVIDAAQATASTKNQRRKSIYIIDGDLFLLIGEQDILPPNVIVLPRYCIENFLIDEHSILNLMNEEDPSKDIVDLKKQLDYQGWLERSKEHFRKLFILFAIAQKLDAGIRTVSRGYSCICNDNSGEICNNRIERLQEDIEQELILLVGEEKFTSIQSQILDNVMNDLCFVSTYVSAKDFSLPLLSLKLRNITKSKIPNVNLKLRLASKVDIAPLEKVANEIRKIVGL